MQLTIDGVSKTYPSSTQALKDVSLTLTDVSAASE
jgi:ABC-type phosphate/phosphonate transport system ATPase subunit